MNFPAGSKTSRVLSLPQSVFFFLLLALGFLIQWSELPIPGYFLWGYFLGIFFFLALLCLWRGMLPSLVYAGKAPYSLKEDVLSALKYFFFLLPFLGVLNLIFVWLHEALFSSLPDEQFAVRVVKKQLQSGASLRLFLTTCLLAPIYEEWVVRGVFQRSWGHYWGIARGICLSSFFFSLAHLKDFSFGEIRVALSLFIFSLFLGKLYEQRKSLLAPIFLHSLMNTYTFTVLVWIH